MTENILVFSEGVEKKVSSCFQGKKNARLGPYPLDLNPGVYSMRQIN